MELTDALLGDIPMIVAAGTIDQRARDGLQTALRKWTEARHNIVFLDLTEVTQMDEVALPVLADWVEALHGRGWLGVISPADGVRRLLEDKGLLAHPNVRTFETRQAARMATGERQST
ncbi:MAG: STAS domain-containing protein [Actinobacteria bacterium]|nr:STAS domain-containing protein [Actinomycetota bacterium]